MADDEATVVVMDGLDTANGMSIGAVLKQIQIQKAFLASLNPVLQNLERLEGSLGALQKGIEATSEALDTRLSLIKTLRTGLEEADARIRARQAALTKAEGELARQRLTEAELERLRDTNLSVTNLDYLEALERLVVLYPVQRESLEPLVRASIYPTVSLWAQVNLSRLSLDCWHPRLTALLGLLLQVDGEEALQERLIGARTRLLEARLVGSSRIQWSPTRGLPKYAMDLLAWLHAAFLDEQDLMRAILPESFGQVPVLVAKILGPAAQEVAHRLEEAALTGPVEPGQILGLLLMVAYYDEWYRQRIKADPGIGLLCSIAGLRRRFAGLLETLLAQEAALVRCDAAAVLAGPVPLPNDALQAYCQLIVVLRRVQTSSLGPSDAEGAFSSVLLQGLLETLMEALGLAAERANLSPMGVIGLRLNCLDHLGSLLGPQAGDQGDPVERACEALQIDASHLLIRAAFVDSPSAFDLAKEDLVPAKAEIEVTVLGGIAGCLMKEEAWVGLLEPVQSAARKDTIKRVAAGRLLAYYERLLPDGRHGLTSPEILRLLH